MSAPKLDVLAVMDVRRHLCVKQSTKNANAAFLDWRDWCNYLPEADNARAAVAELVEAAKNAKKCLQRGLEIDWSECTCDACPECGKQPNDCSGTECSETCQCSLCDHCCATEAIEAFDTALANIGPQS